MRTTNLHLKQFTSLKPLPAGIYEGNVVEGLFRQSDSISTNNSWLIIIRLDNGRQAYFSYVCPPLPYAQACPMRLGDRVTLKMRTDDNGGRDAIANYVETVSVNEPAMLTGRA